MPKILPFYRASFGGLMTLLVLFLSPTAYAQFSVQLNGEDPACAGLANGSVTADPSGGNAPFSYRWNTGDTTSTIRNLNAGNYAVTVTDEDGRTATDEVTLTEPEKVVVTIDDPTDCDGPFDIAADARGGNPPYRYNWSTGADTRAIRVPVGDYCVTVVDDNLCGRVACITIERDPLEVDLVDVDLRCFGDSDGSIRANPRGGQPPYSYRWSNADTTRTIDGLDAGRYTLTVTDARGCTVMDMERISQPPALRATISGDDEACEEGSRASLSVRATGGRGDYSYDWSTGDNTADIDLLGPGEYFVTVTDGNGCAAVDSFTIQEAPPVEVDIIGDNFVCGDDNTTTITARPAVGQASEYNYEWSTGEDNRSIDVGPGTYSVTITDENGCTGADTIFIDAFNLDIDVTGTDPTCVGANDGTATASASDGTGPFSYLWNTGERTATIDDLGSGTYSVTATDANGCKVSEEIVLEDPDPINITVTPGNVLCEGEATGSVDVEVDGGTAPYTYSWSTGATTADLDSLPTGTYTLTVRDANRCRASTTVTIAEPDALRLRATTTRVACVGDATGAIDLRVSGGTVPYEYDWSNGDNTQDIDQLAAGDYTVTVTDANDCEAIETFTVRANSPIDITGDIQDADCADEANGSIDLTVTGGDAPYTYLWSTGATTRDLDTLLAATYTVTVTDDSNCEATETFTVGEPDALELNLDKIDPTCVDNNDGEANATASGGTPPYRYRWNTGERTASIDDLGNGTFSVTVTDANGCRISDEIVLEDPEPIVITPTGNDVPCAGDTTGSIAIDVDGGSQPYTYAWNTDATTADLDSLPAGTYTLTVTDANGCDASTTVTIGQPNPLRLTATATRVACEGDATGAIDLRVTGGTTPYSYDWSNGDNDQDIDQLVAGDYTVTVTDANDCEAVETFTVRSNTIITVTGVVDSADCAGEASGSIDITVSGGSAPYSYDWSNGESTQDINDLLAGDYQVTVTDDSNCSTVEAFSVGEPDSVRVNVTATAITCGGTSTGSIVAQGSGGTGPYTYVFSDGQTGASADSLLAGSYSVTVTDANGCTAMASNVVLSELPQLSCTVEIVQQPTEGDNGELSVEVDGGAQPYTYAWSNGETTQSIDSLPFGTYSVTITDANNCTTTCTATLRALSGIGDYVWQEIGEINGQQDDRDIGISDFPVFLKDAQGNIIDSTRTDADGFYSFMGLEPGTYSILFDAPEGALPTLFNEGDDASDSDADPSMGGMTQNYTLAPGEFNMTVDAGFVSAAEGGISDPCDCLNNNTTDLDGQFNEEVTLRGDAGQTWTITRAVNMFERTSQEPPVAPIVVPAGTELEETSPGVYQFGFRLVDSTTYEITVTNGVQVLTFSNTCFYPVVRFADNIPEQVCVFESAYTVSGTARLLGMDIDGTFDFFLNGQPIDSLVPGDLDPGDYELTGEFTPDDPDECITSLFRNVIVVEECPAKLGDFVWLDTDYDGIQDDDEPGIEGIKVTVTSQDGTYEDTTMTDENGMYMFSVPPGTYKVTFMTDDPDLRVSPQNQGDDDALDSDVDPNMLMTPFYTVGPNGQDFTIDAGFNNPCIDNIGNPGTIKGEQRICGPGNVPAPLMELAPATGGTGPIEYLWMRNTNSPNDDISLWKPIPNSNTPNYTPGPVSETTYYTRCVRRADCPFVESNTVTVTVGDDAVGSISGPNSSVCRGDEAVFQAVGVTPGARLTWNFTGSASQERAAGSEVRVSWATFGRFSVSLTIQANGCTSTVTSGITITNNPNRCGGNLTANGTINSLQQRDVTIAWSLADDGTDYNFELERSVNGRDFEAVGTKSTADFVTGAEAHYRMDDVSPLAGRTFYRVRMMDEAYVDLLSNVVELQLAASTPAATAALGRIFPNPARGGLLHVEMTEMVKEEGSTSVQLYDVRGNLVGNRQFVRSGTGVINLPTGSVPSGVYFVRLTVDGETETHRVIVE